MSTMGKFTINLVLHEFVWFVNQMFQIQITWFEGKDLVQVMIGFRKFCNLLTIHGTIDITQIHVFKPKGQHVAEYLSYKSKVYNMQFQTIVDYKKKFRIIFVGMSRSINDAYILCISSLHHKATHQNLFEMDHGEYNIKPYIIGDKIYPLLPWLMIPHKQRNVWHIILGSLFNR